MKERIGGVMVAVAALGCQVALAVEGTTNDKAAAELVIKGLYAKKISELEQLTGRLNMERSCKYLRTVFEPAMLPEGATCSTLFRFPNLSAEDLFLMSTDKVAPKGSIVQTRVEGGEAVVKVKAPIGPNLTPARVVYFMRKSDAGWRVFNVLSYDEWPLDTNREGGCKDPSGHYRFAQPPRSEADLEDLPPLCRKLESDNFKRNGWGK